MVEGRDAIVTDIFEIPLTARIFLLPEFLIQIVCLGFGGLQAPP